MTVELKYNPYMMKTTMIVDGEDVRGESSYAKFTNYISAGIPLQNWIDPIEEEDWAGFAAELTEIAGNGGVRVEVSFYGRRSDFEDLEESIARREDKSVEINCEFHETMDDQEVDQQIAAVVRKMRSKAFKDIIDDPDLRLNEDAVFQKAYDELEENYRLARQKEFRIIFAGMYSSGKSTLINALVGKRILPTANRTCTSKVFRIRHEAGLALAKMRCIDENGKEVVKIKEYQTEEELQQRFCELFPCGKDKELLPSNPPEVEEVELYTDLSHLYPEGFQDKFNLVLVDTPGTSSGQGNDEEQGKRHIDITLDVIKAREKEMVVLVANGQEYQDDSIADLMGEIDSINKDGENAYNQRFLFVLNKCDAVSFKSAESTEDLVRGYKKYITDDGARALKSPRIFPIAAQAALAIREGLTTEDSMQTEDDQNFYNTYDAFLRRCNQKIAPEHYFFERNCATSERIKADLSEQLAQAREDLPRQALIHSGIPSLEMAIRDYIERYAYPLKVKSLLGSFQSILNQTDSWTNKVYETLEQTLAKMEVLDQKKKKRAVKRAKRRLWRGSMQLLMRNCVNWRKLSPTKEPLQSLPRP